MKRSRHIQAETPLEQKAQAFDARELDNDNAYNFWSLNYRDRLQRILQTVRRLAPPRGRILELGAAQGNTSLLLAEENYACVAVELQADFIRYSKKKYERGDITWIQSNLFDVQLPADFDVVILTEIIEHVAYPEKLVNHALSYLKPGGLLILTTPNAQTFHNTLPHYSHIQDFKELEKRQFGPEGGDHLFAFTRQELTMIAGRCGRVLDFAYGGSLLLNTHTQWLLDLPGMNRIFSRLALALNHVPLLNERLGLNLWLLLQKTYS